MKPQMSHFGEIWTWLGDDEAVLFGLTAAHPGGRLPANAAEEELYRSMAARQLVAPADGGTYRVPEALLASYNADWSDGLETLRRQRTWLLKCLAIAGALYGGMTWGVLLKLYRRRFREAGAAEVQEVFRGMPAERRGFTEVRDRLVRDDLVADDAFFKYAAEVQRNKPFYIPNQAEIEEYHEEGCLPETGDGPRLMANRGHTDQELRDRQERIRRSIRKNRR